MQAVDIEVLGQIETWLASGESCWLATVVKTWGSSPRPVGSLLACNTRGQLTGSLSGGCVEDDLLEKLMAGELAREAPQFFQYGITDEETERLGLPCGGSLYIVVEPFAPASHLAHAAELSAALAARKSIARRVDLNAGTSSLEPADDHADLVWDEDRSVMVHTLGPRAQLFVIGAGMVSRYIADFAIALDYAVTVCDPREHLLDDFGVEGVRLVAEMPDDAIKAYASDPSSAIVAMTHDPRIDDMGLMEALKTRAFYVGAMGSTKTTESRRARLLELDVSAAELDRLHAPIGIPIGSKTPPEIAISVLAEITAVRKASEGAARAHAQRATAAA